MPANTQILISGAGIAGLTLAWWLKHFGFEPTLVEKRPDLSDEGYMIDFYGSGFDVAEKMGLLDELRARHYALQQLVMVDDQGRTRATLSIEAFRQLLGYRHFNFMRGDLAAVLYASLHGRVPVRFDTAIVHARQQPGGVDVELTGGKRETYDLLIGAGGIHSGVRGLMWGAETQFERPLGFGLACGVVPRTFDVRAFCTLLRPHGQAAVYPIRGDRLATFFAFHAEDRPPHHRPEQLEWLADHFRDAGWIVPALLEAMRQSTDLYVDAASQIEVDMWHRGRVALVGDACQCLTLLAGQGASMAMAGAYLLAEELRQAAGDYETAFTSYQVRLKPEIDRRQAQARRLAKSFVPNSQLDIRLAAFFLKAAFWPGFRTLFRRQVGASSIIH